MTDFYKNLFNVAKKTNNGLEVDTNQMLEGLEESGMQVTKIGASHIISKNKLTEEEIAEYQRQEDERNKTITSAYTKYMNNRILEYMKKEGYLKYHETNTTNI